MQSNDMGAGRSPRHGMGMGKDMGMGLGLASQSTATSRKYSSLEANRADA